MILDNEQQRGLLMHIINAAPISGPYQQVRVVMADIDGLIVAITNAQIAPPKGGAATENAMPDPSE